MPLYLATKDDMEDAILAGYSGPGWYFWDETDAHIIGPYKSVEEADAGLRKYSEGLNKGRGESDG